MNLIIPFLTFRSLNLSCCELVGVLQSGCLLVFWDALNVKFRPANSHFSLSSIAGAPAAGGQAGQCKPWSGPDHHREIHVPPQVQKGKMWPFVFFFEGDKGTDWNGKGQLRGL